MLYISRDVEIYLSAVFFYLTTALPHHIDPPPKTCRPMTRNKHPRKKMKELLSERLTTLLLYLHHP